MKRSNILSAPTILRSIGLSVGVEINKIPIVPRIPYHSVIGDRGKGDTPDSSDGVVAYWSSRLDGAVSEKIVPSGHGSHAHPEGIAESRRILLLHLESN